MYTCIQVYSYIYIHAYIKYLSLSLSLCRLLFGASGTGSAMSGEGKVLTKPGGHQLDHVGLAVNDLATRPFLNTSPMSN